VAQEESVEASPDRRRRDRGGRRGIRGLIGAVAFAVGAVAIAGPATAYFDPAARCGVAKEFLKLDGDLRTTEARFIRSTPILIVALGSSSTEGSGASNPRNAYPARLDDEMDRRFPTHHIDVVNKGKGGELAADMLARLDRDVIALKPTLVIWQTGVNDAVRDVGVERYKEQLREGIARLRAAGIDVILVNLQFYPRAERLAHYMAYVKATTEIAADERVPLLRRFAIMKELVKTGKFTVAELLAPDSFHMNDLSYGCLAYLLAEALSDRLDPKATERVTAKSGPHHP
jgi:acyl-CoA thioesterase I